MKNQISEADFSEVYDKYKWLVYSIAKSYLLADEEAEEKMQEVFERFLDRFSDISDMDYIKNWLCRTTKNLCTDYFRKEQRQAAFVEKADKPEESQQRKEEDEEVYELVTKLPPKIRAAMVLCFYDVMSVKEVAQALHISEASALKRLQRGRDTIRFEVKN